MRFSGRGTEGDMNVKMTFTIPEEIARSFRDTVPQSKRSGFVAKALGEKLHAAEKERLEQELIESYIERYDEDQRMDKDWESATLQGWL